MPTCSAVRARRAAWIAIALLAIGAAPAAATTRYASPNGSTAPSECGDAAAPCSLPKALTRAAADDTISLAGGTYDVKGLVVPNLPLHWTAGDRSVRPVLTSPGPETTMHVGGPQSGSSFEGIEIDNTSARPAAALSIDSGVDAIVRRAVLRGGACLTASDGDLPHGEVLVEDSALAGTTGQTCVLLGRDSVLRGSTVTLGPGLSPAIPPAAVVSRGLVEDTLISGGSGLQLADSGAVARRVSAKGVSAIWGEGLVVDSLAQALGSLGAAVAVDTPTGGTLRVVNVTAFGAEAPAFEARPMIAPTGSSTQFNILRISNSIAWGTPVDLRAIKPPVPCPAGKTCDFAFIQVDHSNFALAEPQPGDISGVIQAGRGNQSGAPLLVDPAAGDFHLRAGSPAIDAGDDPLGRATPSDLDGLARVRGAAIDLGAYEFVPAVAPPGPQTDPAAPPVARGDAGTGGSQLPAGQGSGSGRPAADTTAPVLGALRLSRSRLRTGAGTALTATTNEAGGLAIVVEQVIAGHRDGTRCVAARRTGVRCIKRVARGALSASAATPGPVQVRFSGRIGSARLKPGRYRFVVTAVDAAGNRSKARGVSFTVVRR